MSGQDASWYDMPGSPSPGSLRREPDEPLLDLIVAGTPLPDDAPQRMVALASGLAELAGPAGPGELAGEADVLSAYSATVSPAGVSGVRVSKPAASARPNGHARRGSRRSPVALRVRMAAAIAVAGIVASGTAAAYAGALPPPVQDLAHTMIGAPPGHQHDSHAPAERPRVTGRSDRGRHGAPSDSRGQRGHRQAAHGRKARDWKARDRRARDRRARDWKARGTKRPGWTKVHGRPQHPARPQPHGLPPVRGPRARG
jgi:hypothetical protein